MSIDLRIEDTALPLIRQHPAVAAEALARWQRRGGQLVRGNMVRIIRRRQQSYGRTGTLSNSVTVLTHGEPGKFTVAARANYASYVNDGTRPHIIRPRRAQALAFPGGGGRLGSTRGGQRRAFRQSGGREVAGHVVFARSVRHPGTKPMRFKEDTEKQSRAPLQELLDRELQSGFDQADQGAAE